MKKNIKHLGVTLMVAVCVCMLTSCGDVEPPDAYTLDGDSVVSLNVVVGEDSSGELSDMETPETQGDGSSSQGAGVGSTGVACLYTYKKLETGGKSVEQYVANLTGEDGGFQIVDENGLVTDAPDYTQEEGNVAVAKASSEDGKMIRLDISWTKDGCQITMTRPEGAVEEPKQPVEPMTYDDAVTFILSLSPSHLQLPGESMSSYVVYPMDGGVIVDGTLCLKLMVYYPGTGKEQANVIAGEYLLSGDKTQLYLLKDHKVTKMDM
jgi:hypothetical protein